MRAKDGLISLFVVISVVHVDTTLLSKSQNRAFLMVRGVIKVPINATMAVHS